MRTYTESSETTNISTVLPGHHSFQESFDQFVAEFETDLNRVYGKESEGWELDCAEVYVREGEDFEIDVTSDPTAWEWY